MKNKITKLFIVLMFSGFAANAQQTEEDVRLITKDYDLNKLKQLSEQFKKEYEENYAKGVEIANQKGWPIEGYDNEGRYFSLQGVVPGTENLKYYTSYNNSATKSSIQTARAQDLHTGSDAFGINITGQGINVGIWDGGAVYAAHSSLGVSRVTQKDNSQQIDDHASHVAGTMIANETISDIKGIAYQGNLWANDWGSDRSEMTIQAAEGLLMSNHSYGANYVGYGLHNNPTDFGRYSQDARSLDLLLFTADNYLPVFAAGNDRNGGQYNGQIYYFNTAKGGADLMHGDAVSKNAVVVAAVEGITNYQVASDVIMSSFSQWGPTDDFRIKPDISAKGVAVKSVGITNPSSTLVQQGTSMAAPSVTAVFALWQQYFKHLYPTKGKMRAATVKALMAISADEAGSYKNAGSNVSQISGDGPDHRFGWGLINAKRGAEILRDSKPNVNKTVVQELVLNNGETYEYPYTADGSRPLKAAIAWTDPAGNVVSGTDSATPVLVNDLDLRIIRPNGEEIMPWALNKVWNNIYALKTDNNVDPIEVVEYKGAASGVAAAGDYIIRVTHKGTLVNGSQKFSLIIDGSDIPLSTKKESFDNLLVYPNPANDVLTISADLVSIADAKVQIFDLNGKKVFDNSNLFYNTNLATINISNLAVGTYLLKLTTNETDQTVKIVKK